MLLRITVIITSCKKVEKIKLKPSIIELTSSYFSINQNILIYYTRNKNLDSIRTALVKEKDRLSKEQKNSILF
ncbi:hypothetical protein [Lutibacter sp.]